jgi:outer membrane protein assembly factor BamB
MSGGPKHRRLVVALGCVLAVVAAAGCDWNQLGFDPAQTSYNTSESALTASSVRNLGVAWTCPSQSCSTAFASQVVVGNGKVFAPGPFDTFIKQDDVVALDAVAGTTSWTHHFFPASIPVAVANGLVYVGVSNSENQSLAALDEPTGALRWDVALPAPAATFPALVLVRVSGSLAVALTKAVGSDGISTTGGVVSAVDTAGRVVWSATPGGNVENVAVTADGVTALWSETLGVAPFVRTHLTTYGATDGHVVRSLTPTLDDGAGHAATPDGNLTIGNGVAYLTAGSSTGSGIFAVDTTSGDVRWSAVPGAISSLVLAPGRLLSVNRSGGANALVARDPATGAVQWSSDVPATSGGVRLSAAGELVYTAGAGIDMYSISDGSHAARFAPPNAHALSVVPSEGRLYTFWPAGIVALQPTG